MIKQLKNAGKVMAKVTPAALIDGATFGAAKAGYKYVKGEELKNEEIVADVALGTGVSLVGRMVAFAVYNRSNLKKIEDDLNETIEGVILESEEE